ncbi:MAG: hypothetical protein M3619_32110 [Myxococcota bacterium]|nr:hypothetical protein [Myxococcota bacterium]
MRLLVICLVSWLALASCVDPADPIEPQITSGVLRKEIPMVVNRQLDLLFVIDSSPAMAPHRERLLASYRDMISALRTLPGGLPDLHLAVVTADLGTHSLQAAIPGCTLRGDDAVFSGYLVDEWQETGQRLRNYSGDLEDAFVRIADVGSSGCPITQPLEAARRALVAQPENAGFLRPNAYLGIVVLAANDDCSFSHASFLDGATDATRCAERADALTPVAHFERVLTDAGVCWKIERDPQICPDSGELLRLESARFEYPQGVKVVAECAIR